MAEFDFTPPDFADQASSNEGEGLIGVAESEGRQIRVKISQDGYVGNLEFAPALLRRGRNGVAVSSSDLAEQIRTTVNAAIDDLVRKYQASADAGSADLQAKLEATSEDFQRELDQVYGDLLRAKQRLDEA